MWIVKLVKKGASAWPYKENYFPRSCHYKIDALKVKENVEKLGGKAVIERISK